MRSLLVSVLVIAACPAPAPRLPDAAVAARPSVGATAPSAPAEVSDPFRNLAPPTLPPPTRPPDTGLALGPVAPPLAGEKAIAFPPSDAPPPPRVNVGPVPLEVLRSSPHGDTSLTDSVSVTFNQPMVALEALSAAPPANVPLVLEPPVPGAFRWLDTQTLVFVSKGRLPIATTYLARVPAGTRSALGAGLAQDFAWKFQTERPVLVDSRPGEGEEHVDANALIRLRFNGRMSPTTVLRATRVTLKGKPIAVEVVAPGEALPAGWEAERSVFLRPKQPLPRHAEVLVTLDESLRSEEGPLTAGSPVKFGFATTGPLLLERTSCEKEEPCEVEQGASVAVEFTNELATPQDPATFVRIVPAVAKWKGELAGNTLQLTGDFKPSTTYTLTIAPGLRDSYGQQLAIAQRGQLVFAPLTPRLSIESDSETKVLEATYGARINVLGQNVRSADVRVTKLDAAAFLKFSVRADQEFKRELAPAFRRKLAFPPARDAATTVQLDFKEALGPTGRGAALIELSSPEEKRGAWEAAEHRTILQVTDLGLLVVADPTSTRVLVTSFASGAPLAGVTLRLLDGEGKELASARSDERGLAQLPGAREKSVPALLEASLTGDRAFLLLASSRYSSNFDRPREARHGIVFTERGVYRPGETVHATVIARRRERTADADLDLPKERELPWIVRDTDYKEFLRGTVALGAFGVGAFKVAVPADARLGGWSIAIGDEAFVFSTDFEVLEYRAPQYTVTVERQGEEPLFIGGEARAIIDGQYLFGAPMRGSNATWRLTPQRAFYQPPGHDEFEFAEDLAFPMFKHGRGSSEASTNGRGVLDERGRLALQLPLPSPSFPSEPATYELETQVIDRNRQAVAARTSWLAHRADRYVGVRLPQRVVSPEQPFETELIVTAIDGQLVADVPVILSLRARGGDDDSDLASCELRSGKAPVRCSLIAPSSGEYVVRAVVRDAAGRENVAASPLTVIDGEYVTKSKVEAALTIVADQKSYRPGDVARLVIRSPMSSARGFFTVSREGFDDVRPVEIVNGSAVLELPIRESWIPGVHLGVALVQGRTAPALPGQDDVGAPRAMKATLDLSIPTDVRRLQVTVTPSAPSVAPGGEVRTSIVVRDGKGRPVRANVVLMVVDEGVLSLSEWKAPEVLAALYPAFNSEAWTLNLFESLLRPGLELTPEERGWLLAHGTLYGSSGGKNSAYFMSRMKSMSAESSGGEGAPSFDVRAFFASTAYFNAAITTDAEGRAQAVFQLPDDVTTFRLTAVAADSARLFGHGESQVQARRSLIVRPSLPRFLNVGDTFEAAAVVHNETGADVDVEVRLLAVNATVSETRRRMPMKAGESKEVRFPARAGVPGPAKFQFAAVALTGAAPTDAAELTIPIRLPATAEAVATYGAITDAVRQPLVAPANALPGYGGLELQLASTQLQGLEDAVSYLVEYPYECSEQTASRLLVLSALKDVLVELRLGSVDDESKRAALADAAVERLAKAQRRDGAFGLWEGSEPSLYLTAYVLQALEAARAAGTTVDESRLAIADRAIRTRLATREDDRLRDSAARALAMLVLGRRGSPPIAELEQLAADETLPLFATAWIYEAAARVSPQHAALSALRQRLANAATETAGTLHFAEARSERLRVLMHSEDRTDAIVLGALLAVNPKDALVEKLARGLQKSRVNGRWSTTQANAYALVAMRDYFRIFESEKPAFDARAWFGEIYLGGRRFEGRETSTSRLDMPLASLLGMPQGDLVLAKSGPGRLYYRLGLRYAPADLALPALDRGFAITRTYVAADHSKVTREADGTWRVAPGAEVQVRLELTVPDRRYYVALVDPLPAGFEVIDPALATSGRPGPSNEGARFGGWWSPWTHQELKDDRVQLFADQLSAGVYTYTYRARATTPGRFVAPPTRAEEMYAPETFGRSDSARVFIAAP